MMDGWGFHLLLFTGMTLVLFDTWTICLNPGQISYRQDIISMFKLLIYTYISNAYVHTWTENLNTLHTYRTNQQKFRVSYTIVQITATVVLFHKLQLSGNFPPQENHRDQSTSALTSLILLVDFYNFLLPVSYCLASV